MGSTKGPKGPFLLTEFLWVKYIHNGTISNSHPCGYNSNQSHEIRNWSTYTGSTGQLQQPGAGHRSEVQRGMAAWSKKLTGRLPEPASGKATHWIWEFDCERDQVFLQDGDPVYLLVHDLDHVPIITGLDNSTDIDPAAFQTQGDTINTWVTMI